jgi:mRNA interferase MazF
MISGTQYDQGDIVIIPFPFSDLSTIKQRPVLILSNNDYNKATQDLVTCGITSNLKNEKFSILIDTKDLSEGSIPTKSRIKVDKIFTLHNSLVRKKLSKINSKVFNQVKNEIQKLL